MLHFAMLPCQQIFCGYNNFSAQRNVFVIFVCLKTWNFDLLTGRYFLQCLIHLSSPQRRSVLMNVQPFCQQHQPRLCLTRPLSSTERETMHMYKRRSKHTNTTPSAQPTRVVNRPHFEARNRHLFLKPDLGPKHKFTEWISIYATAWYWWRSKVNVTKQFAINHFLLKT